MESPVRRSKEMKKGRSVPEINNMEHINAQLKGKLKVLAIEMKDAVERMNSMTAEMNSIKTENITYKDRLDKLEKENALLVSQVEEMANERAERDAIIDEFSTAVETRIIEWKEILDEKDSTIAKLKENLMCASGNGETALDNRIGNGGEIERLIRDIDRRDEIIAELQSKLAEAVVEINESSLLIEKFKSDGGSGGTGSSKPQGASKRSAKEQRIAGKRTEDASRRISMLESMLERAEADAKTKSEQLCEALAILNKYEDEDSSLADALEEIKELKNQLGKKNKHIEDLVDVINGLEMENSRYEEVIIVLRDKLEELEGEEFSLENLILQRQKTQEEKDEEVRRNYDQLASENVDLKFQVRKLKTALKASVKTKLNKSNNVNAVASDGENIDEMSHRSESQKDQLELRRIKDNVKWIIEENEALRQGMHEILDSIHNQDGKSIVTIQSQTLENLLEALDARHVAGWYHPAMRLQGRVNYLQGSNAELRAQLQQIRRNQMLHEAEALQRSSSVEEGECRRQPEAKAGMVVATELTMISPSQASPKSSRSVHSPNADSGRASGKADDLLQAETPENVLVASESSPGDTPMNDAEDEGFGKKSEEIYAMTKEIVAQESDFKQALLAAEQRQRELEARVVMLQRNLASHVTPEVHEELRLKYLESSMRLRAAIEDKNLADGETKDAEAARERAMQELRNELLVLHRRLAELSAKPTLATSKDAEELKNRLAELELENEKLKRSAELAIDEAHRHRVIDSAVLAELKRIEVMRMESDGEDQAPEVREAARLAMELVNYRIAETDAREQKRTLERDLARARQELEEMGRRRESDGEIRQVTGRKVVDEREYIEIIDFLQHQYAGSTSLSAYERYEAGMNKLNSDRNEVKELIAKINERNESLKVQHETLASRLQIVEQLKDMLEQQIGSNEVQDLMKRFTDETKKILAESKYKMQVNQLEEESRVAKKNLADYESKLAALEREISKAQKAWRMMQKETGSKKFVSTLDKVTETEALLSALKEAKEKSAQTEPKIQITTETQCALCCKSGIDGRSSVLGKDAAIIEEIESDVSRASEEGECAEKTGNVTLLQEQLGQALNLASERSVALSKSESQLVELRAKITGLTKLLDERQLTILEETTIEPTKDGENGTTTIIGQPCVATSQEALQSTIRSLERIVAQKEETIARYQALIKEDRDKHSEAAARLQDEIKCLKRRIAEGGAPLLDSDKVARSECPERDLPTGETEDTSILREKISRLETELGISAELAERWHRLAEDRLRHMDSMRERLEDQHKEEIESYRKELNKRQQEISELRRQISESRRAPTTKSEVLSFMKTLQIKDNRLADEIENELEKHAKVTSKQQLSTTYTVEDSSRLLEIEQSQSQLDNLRKQLQASMERERSHKSEIAELQKQLSRRHMAVKAQEKKASRREMQLERKVKELEEELHEAKEMLDRHFMVQQAKRAKTAEDLGLWEKLKKWQQTAEKLKEKLKDKSDECQRLQANYEKLRNLIACMEREKLFLRERKYYRSNSESASSAPVTPPTTDVLVINNNEENEALIEELRTECHELRCRVKELLIRLSQRESEICEEKNRYASSAFEDDKQIVAELKRTKELQEMLEKENLRLEAENFELRLELERANVNLPRFEEKVQHLEKYVELLKTEKSLEAVPRREGPQRSKTELERTVLTLKNLVEKLQQENKRLRNSVIQSDLDSQCNCLYLREEYEQAKHRIAFLETELELAQRRITLMAETAATIGDKSSEDVSEIALLRDQLGRKSELLLKVKDLLAKAAANEKALRQRIQQLEFKQTLSAIPECGASLAIT